MKPTLKKYISRKLGGVEGEIPQLIYMFKKSFTTPNFRKFWNVWNPIYSYILMYYVYKPLRSLLPRQVSLIVTFVVNGLFHDMMVFIILKRSDFIVTKLFLIYGIIVIAESLLVINLPNKKPLRILYNFTLLSVPVLLLT